MRSLILEQQQCAVIDNPVSVTDFENNLYRLKNLHHSKCLFNKERPAFHGLKYWFDSEGNIHGSFTADDCCQGYDQMVHGGVVAAIIDSSMAQCLMGHEVIGYTAELSVRYCKPVKTSTLTVFKTVISSVCFGKMYTLKCVMTQNRSIVAKSTGKFIKINC